VEQELTTMSSTSIGKRPEDKSLSADASNSSKYYTPSDEIGPAILVAIKNGDGRNLKELLQQYDTHFVKNMQFPFLGPIIVLVFMVRQIGIARILVSEYGVDVNGSKEDGTPHFEALFMDVILLSHVSH